MNKTSVTYDKKYILKDIKSSNYNPTHESLLNKICYLAYFKPNDRGLFLCEVGNDYFGVANRIYTSEVNNVVYADDGDIVVTTSNTEYVFELVK